MERDFLGLNSKEPLVPVKREISDEGPEAQWPFLRNASSHPHFMSSRGGASEDDVTRRTVSNCFDHGERTSASEFQNTSLSLSNPVSRPNFTSYGQNLCGANTWQQFLGIPMTVSSPVGPVVGFTDPWKNKSLAGPAQMTIFYGGCVNVYDSISPEKAQAMMLLAGNGAALSSNTTRPQSLSQTLAGAVISNQPLCSPTGPGLTNQLSMSLHPTLQNGSVPIRNDEQVVTKTTVVSSATISKQEPQRAVASRGQTPMPVMTTSAVPQFRKASLARFLEKRKERVMSTMPYSCDKKPQETLTPSNNNTGSVVNSMTSLSAALRGS